MNHRVRARAKFFFEGDHKFFLKGVTYGTFAPDASGYYVGPPEKARLDLSMMREIGVNGVRVYHAPPKWFLDLAYEFGIRVMVTLWWGQNVDFLSSGKRRREIFEKVDSDVKSNAGHPGLFGYLVANEISSTMVRWYGVRRVTEFVENMINVGRDADDDVLFSYASYPPTEYLLPTNMDFYTFNVYLHRRSDFDRYLARLQNLAEDRPLIMGEFGMDTLRHPEEEQAEMLSWHIESVVRGGLAGTFLYTWTDEWWCNGQDITDWAFGLTTRERKPKKALSTVKIVRPLLNYATSAIFQSELQTTVAISNFVGVLTGIANLVLLPFQLLVLSRLIARLGLGTASLIYPFLSLVTVGSLVVAPGLGTAALGYLDRVSLRQAFRLPTDNLLYNAVPQRVKARTRAFVGGLVVPIGAILGGLLLLTPLMHVSWFLPASITVLGLAFVLAALMVRRHYGPALVSLLEQEDYSFLALQPPAEQEIAALPVDPATLERLGRKLSESTKPERTLFMAQLISAVGGEAAVPAIGQAVRATADSRLRVSLVDVLVAADVRSAEARELYVELLADPDPGVRLSAVAGLEHTAGQRDPRYLEIVADLLGDPDLEIRLRVLPALVEADDAARRASAAAQLRALLNAPDPHTRARALLVVGQARGFGFLLELVRSLTDPVDEVRLAAALATEALSRDEVRGGKREMLLALALLLLHDPIERARVAAITVLDQLSNDRGPGASAALGSLVAGLADPSREVSQRAVEALVRAGRRAIPDVQEQLIAADSQLRKLPAVVLARIEPRRYAPLVLGANLDDTLRALYRNLGCLHALDNCPGPAIDLLARALRERNEVLLEELLYLLSSVRDPVSIDTVARSLRSVQPEVRANAVEALESLTAPQTAALIAPLLEPNGAPESRLSLAWQTWDFAVPTPVAALRLLLTGASDSWQRTLAVAALTEISSNGEPQPPPDITELLSQAQLDPDEDVREQASAALAGSTALAPGGQDGPTPRAGRPLSLVAKLVLLQPLPFFRSMTVEQLWDLARACEEELYPAQTRLFQAGDPGGTLYIVISGRVAIEQEKRRDSFARLTTVEARSCLGESDFFDDNRRAHSAIAIQNTLALKLRREPVIALARQHPDLALELINALSKRLREANERVAALTRMEPDKLQRLYDQFDQAA